MTARQFGRDSGNVYGRHALREPGGDNVQRDALCMVGSTAIRAFGIHPTRVDPSYVGRHRVTVDSTRWIRHDNSLARWTHGQMEVIR